ncbi:30S ribosomal protein S20 [Candidatus Bipolaricaulota bacterium]|nr:30S ribosomal protein S20 [Candidatus Bipolaricaulota bacterium]
MPVLDSAKKRLRQNKKRRQRNQKWKDELKQVTNEMKKLISEGKKEEAEELMPELASAADKAAGKGPLHKNKAGRIKSKFAKKINKLD